MIVLRKEILLNLIQFLNNHLVKVRLIYLKLDEWQDGKYLKMFT